MPASVLESQTYECSPEYLHYGWGQCILDTIWNSGYINVRGSDGLANHADKAKRYFPHNVVDHLALNHRYVLSVAHHSRREWVDYGTPHLHFAVNMVGQNLSLGLYHTALTRGTIPERAKGDASKPRRII